MESDELTIKQASDAYGVNKHRIRSAIQRGTLASRIAYGTLRVIKRVDLEAYLSTVKRGNPSPEPRRAKPSPIPEDN